MEGFQHGVGVLIMALLLPVLTETVTSLTSELVDYCETDTFQGRCATNEVIVMQKAIYGRMELGTCLTIDLGFMDCYSDILPFMDSWCSGQMSCDVDVRDLMFVTNPCPDLRSYLQASFTCVHVVEYEHNCCNFPNVQKRIHVTSVKSYLANGMASDSGCGNYECTLQLAADKGQRVNISIYDFDTSAHIVGQCIKYATIKDKARDVTTTVCRGDDRQRHVYTTIANSVEVTIVQRIQEGNHMSHFILEYQALGCADPIFSADGYIQRDGDQATLTCPGSDDAAWEIVCQGGQWLGHYENCSSGLSGNDGGRTPNKTLHIKSRIAVILIVAVAVAVAVAILLIGVVCILRSVRNPNQDVTRDAQRGVRRHPIMSFVGHNEGNEMQQTKIDDHASIDQHGHMRKAGNTERASLSSLLHDENSSSYVDCKSKYWIHDTNIKPGNKESIYCDHQKK